MSKDVDYRPFFGDITSFNDPEYGIDVLPGRQKPKVVISVTMYNESFKELDDSLRGIADNIENLPEFSYGLTIDDIIVIVIIDGRDKMNPSIFQVAPPPETHRVVPRRQQALSHRGGREGDGRGGGGQQAGGY